MGRQDAKRRHAGHITLRLGPEYRLLSGYSRRNFDFAHACPSKEL